MHLACQASLDLRVVHDLKEKSHRRRARTQTRVATTSVGIYAFASPVDAGLNCGTLAEPLSMMQAPGKLDRNREPSLPMQQV